MPNISNGFDLDRVLPALTARKGWIQPTSSEFTIELDSSNLECLSGMPYNFDNPACSPINIWTAQEDSNISESNFNAYLTRLKKQVATDALQAVFRQDALIENPQIIFEKQFRTQLRHIPNASKFCGWQIKVADGDFAVKVDAIGLTMSAPCTVTIYVYNDLIQEPLYTKECTITQTDTQTLFFLDDLILNRLANTHKGGVFFLGYYQDEIQEQGVTATDVFLNWWNQYKIVGYQGFEAKSNYENKTFTRDQYFSNYRTYGLLLEMSTYHDFTNTVIRNAQAFDGLQGLMMASKCIELAIYSNRSNRDNRLTKENYNTMSATLHGGQSEFKQIPSKASLPYKIDEEIRKLQRTFMGNNNIITAIPPTNVSQFYVNPKWGYQI